MSMGATFKNDLMLLVFNNTNIADIGDATGLRGSSTAGSLYAALHTAWPSTNQTTSECAYTSYARVAVARSGSGFTVSSGQVSNTAAVTFPACTGGSESAQFFTIGTASSGTGKILCRGALGSHLGPFVGENSNDQITIKGHGLSVSDRVVFLAPPGAALPTGITEGTVYFVKTAPDGDTITISTTDGGSTLDITADGDGVAFKVVPLSISSGITPNFAIGALVGNAF
jgi:hypothetical protein